LDPFPFWKIFNSEIFRKNSWVKLTQETD